ncbi:MAG TPA: hypothetical protein PK567_06490, partial [Bacillota bacterium]|nr:hypothetical protein [Bacillota bacterium]
TFILNNGDILEVNQDLARMNGFVPASAVLIDGSGVGDADNRVLRDRRLLAEDGVVSVSLTISKKNGQLLCSPVIQSIGFLYDAEAGIIQRECSEKLNKFLNKCKGQNKTIRSCVESNQLRDALKSMLFEQTKRRPLVLISISEV